MGRGLISVIVLVTILMGCEYEAVLEDKVELGHDYFPLEVGRFSIFNVDETIYDVFGETNRQYQIKLHITDSFIANESTNYVISKFVRPSTEDEWRIDVNWLATAIKDQLVLQKSNISYSLLKFPISEGLLWDGNAFNTFEEDTYVMIEVNQPFILNEKEFPTTLTVLQHENLDVIVETDYRLQVFAKDIGLIYNEIKQIIYCSEVDCLGQEKINEGIISKQIIKEYGKE